MVRLTLSQKAWAIGIVMAGLFLAVNLVFVLIGYSTNSPSECKTCHSGSYKLWKENKAHRAEYHLHLLPQQPFKQPICLCCEQVLQYAQGIGSRLHQMPQELHGGEEKEDPGLRRTIR